MRDCPGPKLGLEMTDAQTTPLLDRREFATGAAALALIAVSARTA